MKNLLARGAGLAAVAALVASAGSVPAQAAPIAVPAGVDRSPVAQGAAYLAAQPQADGLIDLLLRVRSRSSTTSA